MTRDRALLFLVLAIAAALRVTGIGFGLPHIHARPDEAQIAGPAVGYLSGNLRPPVLEWPSLFGYTVAAGYLLYFAISRPFGGYATLEAFAESRRADVSPFLYVSRGLSSVMGVLTVWWIFALGRAAFDRSVGVVAAAFLAVSFLHVRDSHFGVTDVAMTGLVVVAVLAILRWRQTGGWRRATLAGLAAGLATSTKYNGLLVCVPFAVAVGQRLFEERRDGSRAVRRAVAALLLFGCAMAVAFLGTSPYVLIDWSRFLEKAARTQSMLQSGHGIVLGRGWIYYAAVVLPAAVGWPVFLAALAGTLALLATRFRQSAVILAFPFVYYGVAGQGYGVFARYILPVVPFLCLTAAWLTVEGVRRVTTRATPAVRRAALLAATLAMMAPTAYKSGLLDRLLTTEDNRIVTARALIDTIPPGSFFYQTGETYGRIPFRLGERRLHVRVVGYEQGADTFTPAEPDWILVQRSPLVLYSRVPAALERRLADDYVSVRLFPAERDLTVERTYDQQDAFYIPLDGLDALERPGPSFELFVRRDRQDSTNQPASASQR